MSNSTTSKQSNIYNRIGNVSWGAGLICGVAQFLYSAYGYSTFGGQEVFKAFSEGFITFIIVGVALYSVLATATYIFREPKKISSSNAAEDPVLENGQTQRKPNLCGKCGSLVMDLDEHLGFHQYMLPGPLGAFILQNETSLSLGVAAGFNPLQDAKWMPPELYENSLQSERYIPGLKEELVQVTALQNGKSNGGYYPLPDDITQFTTIAYVLRGFIRQHFPSHLENG